MRLTMRKGWQGELGGRAKWEGEMGGGWGEKLSESGFAGLLDAQDGETADYLTQRVGHYPDNRSILTFLILTTRVERVPRPVRIALRDTKQGGQRLFTRHASRLFTLLLPNPQLRQPRHDLDRLQADADHLADEAHDVLRVVGGGGRRLNQELGELQMAPFQSPDP